MWIPDPSIIITAEAKAAARREAKNEAINAERARRIEAGKIIDGIYVTGRDEDARNLTNLALAAQVRIAAGDMTTLTTLRDGNNINHDLTPPQMLSLWQKSAEYVSALYEASWIIKAMDPMPEDITDDALWPAVELPDQQ